MTLRYLFAGFAGLCLMPAALAEDGWTGEGSFSAGYTTGNTETTDLGLGLKLNREAGLWTYSFDAAADYGETDSVETRNRLFLAGEVDRVAVAVGEVDARRAAGDVEQHAQRRWRRRRLEDVGTDGSAQLAEARREGGGAAHGCCRRKPLRRPD